MALRETRALQRSAGAVWIPLLKFSNLPNTCSENAKKVLSCKWLPNKMFSSLDTDFSSQTAVHALSLVKITRVYVLWERDF
jgi:hypothetical protein